MRQKIKRYILALDDTALLALYAACWAPALFAPSNSQIAWVTLGHILSAVAVMLVVLFWIHRPSFRLGWRVRDAWPALVVVVAVVEACQAPIRTVATLDLLRTLEMAAVFVWQHGAAALCPHKNTALFGGVPGCPDQVWLEGDCEMLLRCDAVFAIPGWRDSSGAPEYH